MSEERKWKLYCYTNKVNGKKYIGITSLSLASRAGKGGRKYYECRYFGNAIKKYGWDSFSHDIVCSGLTEKEAKELEVLYIEIFKTNDPRYGYNISRGGDVGAAMSTEGRASFMEKHSGVNNPRSKAVSVYSLDGNLIQTFACGSDAARFLGVKDVSESCLKRRGTIREHIVRFASDFPGMSKLPPSEIYKKYDFRLLYKPVNQYSLDGHFIATFPSAQDAAKAVRSCAVGGKSQLCACLKGRARSAYGYLWRYYTGDNCNDIEPYKGYCPKRGADLPQSRKVKQLNLDGSLVAEYTSIRQASTLSGIPYNTILGCLRGTIKSPRRYMWVYSE